jgi:hypothetical protein
MRPFISKSPPSSLPFSRNMKIKIRKSLILLLFYVGSGLYNRVLRRMFALKEEVIGGWRRLHYEELLFTKYRYGD